MDGRERLRSRGRLAEAISLGPLTTYKMGGPARYVVTVEDEVDLHDAWMIASEDGIPVMALGRGSNVVVAESGFDGVVLRPGAGLSRRTIGTEVVAGSGVPLPILARESARAGRGGLEFFAGIPGSVGGAVRMNAGCHGSETKDVLVVARVFDGATGTVSERTPHDLDLSYRHSNLDDLTFVLDVRLATSESDPIEAEDEIRRIIRWRREHQPGGTLNAGSVFKNPPGDSAGRIIDSLGLKGRAVGGVRVSERHANFIVAGDDAAPSDLYRLVREVQRTVVEATGIGLEPEVRFVGDFS